MYITFHTSVFQFTYIKIEQLSTILFILLYTSNNIKKKMNEMTVK